jgi:16S rRNA processing protein RimM
VVFPLPGSEIVILGRIVGPYGIKGWVRVHPFGDDPLSWGEMPVWWLAPSEQGGWQEKKLKSFKVHGDGLLAAFEEVVNRNDAEALKGWWIGAPREALPATDENEFYWSDLIGMTVSNTAGESLGTVKGLIETGANDVLQVVDAEGRERLLPFVAAVVLQVDREARQIRVEWGLDW